MQERKQTARKGASANVRSFSPAAVAAWFCADRLKWEESAAFIAGLLHPKGPSCSKCGEKFTDSRRADRWIRFERIQCPTCKTFSTAATGTILHKSEFDEREIILLAFGLQVGINDKALSQLLRCSSETVRTWRGKFKALEAK